ncbi:MAG: divalent-cation tolerance protein CutA [Candidatus Aminicenantes bacterium]|nr:MAG: divalent-cation tolerance protein CutA [Candidatus Aminicenantes bacterium]
MTKYLLVITTVPDAEVGQIVAEKIIQERLAACVTLSAPSQSLYWWQGKITQDQEHILFVKTKKEAYRKLEEKIRQFHPYDFPEIIALPVFAGSKDYLNWIDDETQTTGKIRDIFF